MCVCARVRADGVQVWLQPPMWEALGGLGVCAPLQLYLIDVCLASGAVTYAVPLYQVHSH